MLKENPAAKLYSILEKVNQFSPHHGFRTVWSSVFEIEETNTTAILQKYSSLLELYLSTKSIIEDNDRLNNPKNIRYIELIGRGLMVIETNGSINNLKSHLTTEVMTALYYIAENVSFVYDVNSDIMNDEQINEIISDVDNLIVKITKSDLPVEVKQILVKNLNIIRESLHDYFITGIEGVKAALEQTLGSLIINNRLITPEVEDSNVKGVFHIMSRLNEFFSTVNGAKELIAPLTKFFINE